MIKRSNPDVGYISPVVAEAMGISLVVSTADTVHVSGIVAAATDGSCVSPGNMARQIGYVIERLGRLLASESLSLPDVLTTTVYTTDIDELMRHTAIFADAFKAARPVATWIEVGRLASADFLVELVATAARRDHY